MGRREEKKRNPHGPQKLLWLFAFLVHTTVNTSQKLVTFSKTLFNTWIQNIEPIDNLFRKDNCWVIYISFQCPVPLSLRWSAQDRVKSCNYSRMCCMLEGKKTKCKVFICFSSIMAWWRFLNFSKCHFFPKDGLFLLGFSLPNYFCFDYLTTPDISFSHALIMFRMLEEMQKFISTK